MKFSQEDWARISSLLDTALELDQDAQRAWLDSLPQEQARWRPALERLLSREAADRFASATLPRFVDPGAVDDAAVGQVVAGYRLLRLLGRGGMGGVWLAERVDAVFQRKVALKLPHLTLAGASFVERFHRERDILASLDFPDIARLYDAGVTAIGQPFLALEYVAGLPIDAYCDEQRLTIAARIALFQRVLDAVQHAHGQLVVHRDIKPSNIFITREGNVRLLDFGIAKIVPDAASAPADAPTELTRTGGRLLTLAYASPEHVAGKPVGIASDIYSLGVVLYQLLAGSRPYRVRRDSAGALEDAVLSGDLLTLSETVRVPEVAERRRVSMQRLRRELRGDLDAILGQALRTDPEQRYPTCEAFGRDLARFLRGEAVLARRGSRSYRLAKFMRRNWLATGATMAIITAFAIGGAAALWQAGIARENAARAHAEAARAERERAVAVAVKEFLVGVFRVNDPEASAYAAQGARPARDLLADGVTRLRHAFAEQPETKAELYDAVIEILVNLDDLDAALALARESVAHAASRLTPQHELYAAALLREAMVRRELDQIDDARRLAGVVAGILDAKGDRSSALRGRLLIFVGTQLGRTGAEGLQDLEAARRGIALLALNGADPAVRAQALLDVAFAYAELNDEHAALASLDAARDWMHGFEGADLMRSRALASRVPLLLRAGKAAEAEASSRQALDALSGMPPGHPEVLRRMQELGSFLHALGRRAEGREWLARSLAGMEHAFQPGSPKLDSALLTSLHAAVMDGATESVRRILPRLAPLVADAKLPPSSRLEIGLAMLRWHIGAKDARSAERVLATLGPLAADVGSLPEARLCLAHTHVALLRGALEDARRWSARADELAGAAVAGGSMMPASFASLEARIHHEHLLVESTIAQQEGRFAEAIELAQRAARRVDAIALEPYAEEDTATDALRLGQAHLAAGDAEAALEPLTAALAIYAREHHPSSPMLADARAALARSQAAVAAKRRPAPAAAGKSRTAHDTQGGRG